MTPTVPLGLTDACRLILRGAQGPLTAMQVRDKLGAMGLDLDRYANALAAIHTVLKRLEESGEAALADLDEASRHAYELVQSGVVASRVPPAPAASPRNRSTISNKGRRR